jgi:hypothetical protein
MSTQFAHGYALLIGVDKSQETRWGLPDVGKDVSALQAVLVHPERCAYLPDNVKVVQGEEATRAGILDGLSWLRQKLIEDKSDNETAIVYFTGHGLRDTTGKEPVFYLRPFEAQQDSLRLSALRADDFAVAVQALNPKRLLVLLDCCHSGGMGAKGERAGIEGLESIAIPPAIFSVGAKDTLPDDKSPGSEGLAQGSGRAVLSSSQAGQLSWMRKDRTMSIFTYHLIEALTGHAQPQEGASEVLVSDVMSYVWRKVPGSAKADWSKTQEPNYQVNGNFPVALLLGGSDWKSDQVAPDPLSVVFEKVTDLATELSQTSAELSETSAREGDLRLEVARIKYAEMLKQENERWENERLSYQVNTGDEGHDPSIREAVGTAIAGLGFGIFSLWMSSSSSDVFGSIPVLFLIVGIVVGVGRALYIFYQYVSFQEAERAHWSILNGYSFENFASRHLGLSVEHGSDPSAEHGSKWSWRAAHDELSNNKVESRNPE